MLIIKRLSILFAVPVILLLCPGSVFAAQAMGDIIIEAGQTYYDADKDMFYAEQNVKLTGSNLILTADKLQYNLKEERVYAQGNVRFTQDDLVINAENADYGLATREGTFAKINTLYDRWYYYGDSMKVTPDKIIIENALMTRCEKKHYQYAAKKVEISGRNLIYLRRPRLKLLGLTVLLLPNLYFDMEHDSLWPGITMAYTQKEGVGIGGGTNNRLTDNTLWGTDLSIWSKAGFKGSLFLSTSWKNQNLKGEILTSSGEEPTAQLRWNFSKGKNRLAARFEQELRGERSEGDLQLTRSFTIAPQITYAAGLQYRWDSIVNTNGRVYMYNALSIDTKRLWRFTASGVLDPETLKWKDSTVALYRNLCCVELGITWEQDKGSGLTMGLRY